MQTTPCLHTSLYTGLHTGLRLAGLVGLLALHSFAATAESPSWQQLSFGGDFSDIAPYTDGSSTSYEISSDSQYVVFRHNPTLEDVDQLYSVPLDGSSAPTRISGLLGVDGLGRFEITPDGQHVVYQAKQDDLSKYELYRVPIGGGATLKLNQTLSGSGGVGIFRLSPDGSAVAYTADPVGSGARKTLFLVSISGGTPSTLLEPDDEIYTPGLPVFSPSGDWIVLFVSTVAVGLDLYSVPTSGGGAVRLEELSDFTLFEETFQISPTGSHVAYTRPDFGEFFSVPIAGGTPQSLTGPFTGMVNWYGFYGATVFYQADGLQDPVQRGLFSAPMTGGDLAVVVELPEAANVLQVDLSPDGSRIVYRTDGETDDVFELYSVSSAGGTPVKLNPALPSGAEVSEFKISADGRWVVYRADQLLPGVPTLWRVPIEGPASASQAVFFGSPVSFPVADAWRIDSRSDRVVVLSNVFFVDGVRRPWRKFFAGPEDELVDESEFVIDGAAIEFQFAPNGDVVYRADQNVDEKFELFSVTFPPDEIFGDGFESGDTSAWD